MGFLNKLKNLVMFRGWKEDELIEQPLEQERELQQGLKESENIIPEREITEKGETDLQDFDIEEPLTKEEKKSINELDNAEKRFRDSGKIKDVQQKVDGTNMSSLEFKPTTNLNELNNIYNRLLEQSVISTRDSEGNQDQALIDVLIENRKKLQHRFTAEIVVYSESGVGTLSIDGILAEDLADINNFIQIGNTYTSEELKQAMNNALTYYEKQYGSIGGSVNPPMEKKSTIQNIQIRMTFA